MANNYTLGRGKVYVSRYVGGVAQPHYRYLGNTPEMSLTIESETLDHYSSDNGIREKDDSVPLEVNRTGSLVTDNVNAENVALFFFGDRSVVTQTTVAAAPESFTNIIKGHSYKLGITPSRPAGHFGINPTGFGVTFSGTPGVDGVDYTIDYDAGIITFLETSALAIDGADPIVTYGVIAHTRERVISGSQPIECSMIYRTKNPKGEDCTFFFPYVKLTPNGDYALKGDDWQQIPLSMEILKPTNAEAIYRDGDPI